MENRLSQQAAGLEHGKFAQGNMLTSPLECLTVAGGHQPMLGGWKSLGRGRWPPYVDLGSSSQFLPKSIFHYIPWGYLANHTFKNCVWFCFKGTVAYHHFSGDQKCMRWALLFSDLDTPCSYSGLHCTLCTTREKRKKKILCLSTQQLHELDSKWSAESGRERNETCIQLVATMGQQCLWVALREGEPLE